MPRAGERASIGDLARYFLTLGTVAFGGPAAHIAMMEDQVVRRRSWLSRDEFLDLFAAANLIPGPSSTELAIFIGYRRAGWAGLAVAGICFILPAFVIVLALAAVYRAYGGLPSVAGALYGVKPVVIAVVLQALLGLGPRALKTRWLIAVGVCAVVAAALGLSVLGVLGIGAFLASVPELKTWRSRAAVWLPVTGASGSATASVGLGPLALVFLKVGAVLFGSGYVLLAFLRGDLVTRLHWLTDQQLLDAVAIGQVTPGPVFTTATFVGYVLAGVPGAVVATVAIFLPSFVYVAVSSRLLPVIRRSRLDGAAFDGVTVASLALMTVVCLQLARAAFVDIVAIGLFAASAVALLRFRINSAWLVLAGAVVGLVRVAFLPGAR